MSFLEILWYIFLTICFLALLVCVLAAPSGFCGGTVIVAALLIFACVHHSMTGPVQTFAKKYPTTFFIWNRSGRQTRKAGWQITDYRKPNPHLPADEYMMGVELARSNACYHFDFSRDADIDRFKRCAHFFPEFVPHFKEQFEERVGICI